MQNPCIFAYTHISGRQYRYYALQHGPQRRGKTVRGHRVSRIRSDRGTRGSQCLARGERALPCTLHVACVYVHIRLSICVSAGALWELVAHCGSSVGGLCVHRCKRHDRRHGRHPRDPAATERRRGSRVGTVEGG